MGRRGQNPTLSGVLTRPRHRPGTSCRVIASVPPPTAPSASASMSDVGPARAPPASLADVPAMARPRLPDVPALHDLPNLVPPRVGHWLAERLGVGRAYEFFCHHCPEPTLWSDPDDERIPS